MINESLVTWTKLTHLPEVDRSIAGKEMVYWCGIPMPMPVALAVACNMIGQGLAPSTKSALTKQYCAMLDAGDLNDASGKPLPEAEQVWSRSLVLGDSDVVGRIAFILRRRSSKLLQGALEVEEKKTLFRSLLKS